MNRVSRERPQPPEVKNFQACGAAFTLVLKSQISEPILLDSAGRFDVTGSYTRQGPGPIRQGVQRDARANYSGSVTGETMQLKVRLEGSSEPVFDLSLTRGKQGKVTKCY